MFVIGIAFLIFAALLQFTSVTVIGAACITGIILVVLALLVGERLPERLR